MYAASTSLSCSMPLSADQPRVATALLSPRTGLASPNRRERIVSFVASLLLCTCLASCLSLVARDSYKRNDLPTRVRPAIASMHSQARSAAFNVPYSEPRHAVKLSQLFNATASNSMSLPSISVPKPVRNRPLVNIAPSELRNMATSSGPLIVLSILAISAVAFAGVGLISVRSLRRIDNLIRDETGPPTDQSNYVELDLVGRGHSVIHYNIPTIQISMSQPDMNVSSHMTSESD
jgi:hypothetical protein